MDDEGLSEFYTDYYNFPLYRDVDLKFYEALGMRKLSLPWNPLTIVRGVFEIVKINKRLKKKNVSGNLTGEGLVKGGVVIFGADGKQKYVYEEETGIEVPVEDILAAIDAVREEQ